MLSLRYLHEKPLFRTRSLSVRGLGIRETMPPSYIQRPRGTGDYLVMLFHDPVDFGLADSQGERRLQASSLVIWPRGVGHFYGDRSRRWSHSWVHCDGTDVGTILERADVKGEHHVHLHDPAAFDRGLLALHEEIAGSHETDEIIVRNLLENLIREGVRRRPADIRREVPAYLEAAKALIDTQYERRLTLGMLAAEAHLSPRHFCTQFCRCYGAPPIAYLIRRRLHAAAALLRGTEDPVGDIGRRVGYPDPYYFSKHFKACFGVPPSDVRRKNVQTRKTALHSNDAPARDNPGL